jgi:phage shock protein A
MAAAVEQKIQALESEIREVKEEKRAATGDEKVALQQCLVALQQRLAALEGQKLLWMQQQSGETQPARVLTSSGHGQPASHAHKLKSSPCEGHAM